MSSIVYIATSLDGFIARKDGNLTKIPIVLGSGIPLFRDIPVEIPFTHVETIVYNNMLVRSRYVRVRT